MLEISFDESFKRAYKKRIKGNINPPVGEVKEGSVDPKN